MESAETKQLYEQSELAGKYLTFRLGSECFGIGILKVQEIIGLMAITRVPRMPGFVRGVINLRGKVIPVVDLRLRFGLDSKEDTERTCVIVVQISGGSGQVTMGLIVDEVSEVLDVKKEQIEAPPSFGVSVKTDFLMGMGKIGDKVVLLLEVDRALTDEELSLVGPDATLEG